MAQTDHIPSIKKRTLGCPPNTHYSRGARLHNVFPGPQKISRRILLVLASGLGLGLQVGRGRATVATEKASEQWMDEGVEDDLSAVELGQRHPQNKDELEDIVKWEPVGGIESTFNNGEESIYHPVSQPLSIIRCSRSKQRMKRVIPGNQESRKVNKELAGNVEEHKEEVDADETKNSVDLGDRGLAFEVVQKGVLGELLVKLRNLVLRTILKAGHFSFGSLVFSELANFSLKRDID